MKILGLQFAFLLFFLGLGSQENIPKDYQGKLFQDPAHTTGPRTIPGRLEAVLYDLGGEGIAYHDVDSVNHSSGERPMFAIFAKGEGVDISHVKKRADLNHPNMVTPNWQQLYIGWTEDGEWTYGRRETGREV